MNKKQNTLVFPLAPLKEVVIFPGITVPLYIKRKITLTAIEKCLASDNNIVVVTQKNRQDNPQISDFYTVGTLGKILQIIKLSPDKIKVLFKAYKRVKIKKAVLSQNYYSAEVRLLVNKEEFSSKALEITQRICKNFYKNLKENDNFKKIIQNLEKHPTLFCDFFASTLNLDAQIKQQLLEETNTVKRLQLFAEILSKAEKKAQTKPQTNKGTNKQNWSNIKYFTPQDQIRILEEKDLENKQNPYLKKIQAAKLPKNVEAVVLEEAEKLDTATSFSAESNIIKNYIDWILKIPWHHKNKENLSLKKAQTVLNRNHYGLEKIKERILEFIAVMKVVGKVRGPIICLVGPPGVGKSSLAKTVAESLNREFCHINLGGVRDEAEIRGHRRTYIGSMPGKIIQTMKKAKTINPLILLDEIDKTTNNQMGNPAAALLEVLDLEQNHSFMDHYLDVEYDLSKVLFFCTANDAGQIPIPLLDRMELINLSGYTELEKVHIFKKHLLPKIAKEHGLMPRQITIGANIILKIIQSYTREAGIRELERNLAKICRKIIKNFVTTRKTKQNVIIRNEDLKDYLGVQKYSYSSKNKINLVGVATGLAWTSYGGDIILIEVSCMKGKANIQLTGQLGEVMQESAKTALSFVKSNANNLGIYADIFKEIDIHIHVPDGATPKDGPSAGIALITALVSNLTGIAICNTTAMTGEISLRGRILAIGGLYQKLLAAKRVGITDVIIPLANKKDLAEIPAEILKNLTIHCKDNVLDALAIALERMPQAVDDKNLATHKQDSYLSFFKNPTKSAIPSTDKLSK